MVIAARRAFIIKGFINKNSIASGRCFVRFSQARRAPILRRGADVRGALDLAKARSAVQGHLKAVIFSGVWTCSAVW
jgi:hypothetical protein